MNHPLGASHVSGNWDMAGTAFFCVALGLGPDTIFI